MIKTNPGLNNTLKADPSRTGMLRRRWIAELNRRFKRLQQAINKLVVSENALAHDPTLGYTLNAREFASTHVTITDPDFAAGVQAIQAMLDPADVLKLEDELHITVRFGLHDTQPDRAAMLIAQHGRIRARLENSVSLFSSDEQDVLKISVDPSGGLAELNAHLGLLPNTSTHPVYQPHVTIAYLKPGTGAKYVGINWEEEVVLDFNSVTYSNQDKQVFELPLAQGQGPVALGQQNPTHNSRWRFLTTPQKYDEFRAWLKQQIAITILAKHAHSLEDEWLKEYITRAYSKGMERAFDDTRRPELKKNLEWYKGTKEEFLRSSFSRPVSVEKVKLLASRSFEDLKGISQTMSDQISRELVDGMIKGASPREVARKMAEKVGISKNRALTLARSETIRAHSEGALDAFEALGVEEIGVMVEWSTARDGKVCPLCRPLHGIILKTKEAHGMFPRHPGCRCSPIPANVGESTVGQIRGRDRIQAAIARSLKAEMPRRSKRTLAQQRKVSRWAGAGRTIARKRPQSIL